MEIKLPELDDDGLDTPVVGSWGLRKYWLLQFYAEVFATSMKKKWDCRVYLDLFAGAGHARLKKTNRVIPTSAYLALSVTEPFDRYIFCDSNVEKINTLETRVTRDFPTRSVEYINGDCNSFSHEITDLIPQASKEYKVLTFCFVDPFRMESLCFSTIEEIARKFVDFFVLIPAYMDARRNLTRYIRESNKTVENFLGLPEWREIWEYSKGPRMDFGSFVADQFGNRMKSLNYHYSGLQDTVLVQLPIKNVSLYRLAFFSRHPLAKDFWDQAKLGTQSQLSFL